MESKWLRAKTTRRYIDDSDTVSSFGVKIDKLSSSGKLISSASVNNVGINESDVRSFIKTLNDGLVTPITLKDIVNDRQ